MSSTSVTGQESLLPFVPAAGKDEDMSQVFSGKRLNPSVVLFMTGDDSSERRTL